MTPTGMFISTLYDRLSAIGFDKTFIRSKALPDWWDAQFEATEGAVVEAATYISRRLNLDLTSLLKPDAIPTFKTASPAKFKLKPGSEIEQLKVAYGMASRVAEMVAYACIPESKSLPNSAQQMRDEILTTLNPLEPSLPNSPLRSSQSFGNLERLLEFCWSYGIPVVHFDGFPTAEGVRTFEGLVTFFSNRPVIILSLKHCSFARLLFTLAHQLGHLIQGHGKGFSILDEEIDPDSIEPEELEANEFALELLLGKPDMGYYTPRIFTDKQLAGYAQTVSVRDRVDPGVVALNYAWNKANRASTKNEQFLILETAQKALHFIERDVDAPAIINRYLHRHLDLERLDIDSQDYLELVTAR